MSEIQFIVMPHTHWDREWYLPMEVFRRRLVRLIDDLVDIMDSNPSYSYFYLDGQTIVLDDYEEIRGRNERLDGLIKQGRIDIGPWRVLPDEFLVSGESLIRNLRLGFETSERHGVKPPPVGYLPDMFGHISQMPQILNGFGIKQAVVWRGMPEGIDRNQFYWLGPEGSRVLALYLPLGYGFIFNLPLDPQKFADRIQLFLMALQKDDPSGVYLLTNGTDHWEPEAHIPSMLEKLGEIKPEWSFRMGGLVEYFETVKPVLKDTPEYEGELRSAMRTVIIPSVASSRLYLKQQDFQAASLLERQLEPLSTWSRALGGRDVKPFLDYLWKLLIENHPHDSICGCSIDAVHDEMETRYSKVIQLATMLRNEAAGRIGQKLGTGAQKLCAWNPAPAQSPGIIFGDIEARLPRNPCLFADIGGRERGTDDIPLQVIEVEKEKEDFFKIDIPAPFASLGLIMFSNRELFGSMIQGYGFSRKGQVLEMTIDLGSLPRNIETKQMSSDAEQRIKDSGCSVLRVRVKRLPRYKVAAQVPSLPGFAVSSFGVRAGPSRESSGLIKASKDQLENEVYSISLKDNGEIWIKDKKRGLDIQGPLYLDVGDRGDTYNFDPVPDDKPVSVPVSVKSKLLADGPHAAVLEITHNYRLPAALGRERKSRSKKTVPYKITTRVILYSGDPERIDFITRFHNTVRDHRLQAAFDAPFGADKAWVETPFATVERPTDPMSPPPRPDIANISSLILGTEAAYSTSPQKSFACINAGGAGLAVFNRGLSEVDTVRLNGKTRIALTLVRSIGHLSRGDLVTRSSDAGPPLETPGAQCLRECVCEYALATFSGTWDDANLASKAHHYAYPPLLFMSGSGSEEEQKILSGTGPFTISDPRVEMSAFRTLTERSMELRLYNTSLGPVSAIMEFQDYVKHVETIDLLGNSITCEGFSFERPRASMEFRPLQIVTLKLEI